MNRKYLVFLSSLFVGNILLPACYAQDSMRASVSLPITSVSTSDVDKTLHVTVGRTLFLNSQKPLTQVYVDNPLVLQSYASSPSQLVISGLAPGMATVVLWDKDLHHTSYTVTVDKSVVTLQEAFENEFPMDKIHVSSDRNTVILTGYVTSHEEFLLATKLAASFSQRGSGSQSGGSSSGGGNGTQDIANSLRITPPHLRQVRLEVKFAEIDRTKAMQLGFSLLSLGNATAMSGTGQFPTVSAPSMLGQGIKATAAVASPTLLLYSQSMNLGAAIQDMENNDVLQILAEPTISALSGHTGTFLAGGEFPYPVVQASGDGAASVSVQFMPYGISLTFLPVVLADGTIRLHIAPEVSALDYTNEVVIDGTSEPAISTRRAVTDIELRDGQSFALSGLLDKTITDQFQKMPGISSIPILGALFRSKSTKHASTELLVIVTPHIIDEVSHPDVTPTDLAPVIPYMTNKSFDKNSQVTNGK